MTDAVALSQLRRMCLRFPEAEESELQGRPLFHVRRRRFALFNGAASPRRPRWEGFGRSLHFLTDPLDADALRQDRRFRRSPHHGHRGWLALDLEGPSVDWVEVAELLESAYRRAASQELVDQLDRLDRRLGRRRRD